MKILFVCTGNICRSPTAAGVLAQLAREAGLAERVVVHSAGTGDWHIGCPPDERAQAHALRRGYDLSALRARQVRAEDFFEYDLILAMDRGHLYALQRMCPGPLQPKVRMLIDGRDVPDPYQGGPEGFEQVLDMVEAACFGLLAEVRERLRLAE